MSKAKMTVKFKTETGFEKPETAWTSLVKGLPEGEGLSLPAFAREAGVSAPAVRKAISTGRIARRYLFQRQGRVVIAEGALDSYRDLADASGQSACGEDDDATLADVKFAREHLKLEAEKLAFQAKSGGLLELKIVIDIFARWRVELWAAMQSAVFDISKSLENLGIGDYSSVSPVVVQGMNRALAGLACGAGIPSALAPGEVTPEITAAVEELFKNNGR
jgi:hypothetical protein